MTGDRRWTAAEVAADGVVVGAGFLRATVGVVGGVGHASDDFGLVLLDLTTCEVTGTVHKVLVERCFGIFFSWTLGSWCRASKGIASWSGSVSEEREDRRGEYPSFEDMLSTSTTSVGIGMGSGTGVCVERLATSWNNSTTPLPVLALHSR